jgi:hypothetical protein
MSTVGAQVFHGLFFWTFFWTPLTAISRMTGSSGAMPARASAYKGTASSAL